MMVCVSSMAHFAAVFVAAIAVIQPYATAFTPTSAFGLPPEVLFRKLQHGTREPVRFVRPMTSIIDADFERVEEDQQPGDYEEDSDETKTLLDLSLELDPEWKDLPVPFSDPLGNAYINCKISFMVELDGINYTLATPYESAVVVCTEESSGPPKFLDPENMEENEEIFQMAATALVNEFGDDLRLKRTPRTLTVEGDLDKIVGEYRDLIEGKPLDMDALLEDDDDDDKFFDEIMRRDLGPNYMDLVDDEDEELDEDLLKFFGVPGLGTERDDKEGVAEMLKDIFDPGDLDDTIENPFDDDDTALRLSSFRGPGGREYSILKLLRPMVIVGKEDPTDEARRLLLTPAETADIVPRLEELCQKELQEAGLFLPPVN